MVDLDSSKINQISALEPMDFHQNNSRTLVSVSEAYKY